MNTLKELKDNLLDYHLACIDCKHHDRRKIAHEYGIRRYNADRAYNIGYAIMIKKLRERANEIHLGYFGKGAL